jgi:hypothetical protein
MNKGLFLIPVYSQNVSMNTIFDEIIEHVINGERWA